MAKTRKIPHTFTIVFFLILCAAVLTWIIPGGEFVRHTVDVNGSQREQGCIGIAARASGPQAGSSPCL